jgi:hypothetical protein
MNPGCSVIRFGASIGRVQMAHRSPVKKWVAIVVGAVSAGLVSI